MLFRSSGQSIRNWVVRADRKEGLREEKSVAVTLPEHDELIPLLGAFFLCELGGACIRRKALRFSALRCYGAGAVSRQDVHRAHREMIRIWGQVLSFASCPAINLLILDTDRPVACAMAVWVWPRSTYARMIAASCAPFAQLHAINPPIVRPG